MQTCSYKLRLVLIIGMATGAATVPAQTAPANALEPVTITLGKGQLRSVQGLLKPEFDSAISGTSPLATVAHLPGVNFQAADPLGNYEWSARIAVRAFSQSQIGFTLDDVPLGDMSYTNFNGLHISRAISKVMNPQKPVVGVMTPLPMFGQKMNPMMMRMGQQGGGSEPWVFISELKADFEVKQLSFDVDKIDGLCESRLVMRRQRLANQPPLRND